MTGNALEITEELINLLAFNSNAHICHATLPSALLFLLYICISICYHFLLPKEIPSTFHLLQVYWQINLSRFVCQQQTSIVLKSHLFWVQSSKWTFFVQYFNVSNDKSAAMLDFFLHAHYDIFSACFNSISSLTLVWGNLMVMHLEFVFLSLPIIGVL